MIISHANKFIFIKTFKTAGSSLEIVLSECCGPDDVLTPLDPDEEAERVRRYGAGARNHLLPLREHRLGDLKRAAFRGRRLPKFEEHDPAVCVRAAVGEAVWNAYFKFAVVRDPYDRLVSRYFYSRRFELERFRGRRWAADDIDSYIRYNAEQVNENWALYTERDAVLVDFLVRYERLEADLAEVSRRIGLPRNLYDDMAGVGAKRGLRPPSARAADLLDDRHRALVSVLCAKEIALIGYPSYGWSPVEGLPISARNAPRAPPAEGSTDEEMRLLGRAIVLILAAAAGTAAARAEVIGEVTTAIRILGANHRIVVEVFDDPKVEGVSCYVSRARTGGISGSLGLAEDTSDASIACRQIGPVKFRDALVEGEEVFGRRASALFKRVQVVRFFDEARNTLVYLTYSDRIIEGSPQNAISAVAIQPWN